MDPQKTFCPNPDCTARGQLELGNIKIHSHKDRRYRCTRCNKTFAATKGTPFYRIHKNTQLVVIVLTLLTWGCPVQAIVAAFNLDERTVASWQDRAGQHAQTVQQHVLQQQQLDLQHVQADEICANVVGDKTWMAMAMAVPSRLWLGGVISRSRNLKLINQLVQIVRTCWDGKHKLLVCVDGLASYVTAFPKVFGALAKPFLLMGQVIKEHSGRRLISVTRRVLLGTMEGIGKILCATKTGQQINTSYIERLNATFRSHLAGLVRRGRARLRKDERLTAAMYLVGCCYNFCWFHDSLRLPNPQSQGKKWLQRTPAMAAGLTDRCWSMRDLLSFKVPLPLHG
jgi:transposase-like protein